MTLVDPSLAQYHELCQRLDTKFAEIRARQPEQFACQLGCHSCCKPKLTVSALEAENLRRFLSAHPSLVASLRNLADANPHRSKRCQFLSAAGECSVYEARPLVCRSHGAPLQVRPLEPEEENTRVRDVCPLNFQGANLAALPPESVLNLDTIHTLLALLTRRAFPENNERIPLTLAGLLGS